MAVWEGEGIKFDSYLITYTQKHLSVLNVKKKWIQKYLKGNIGVYLTKA